MCGDLGLSAKRARTSSVDLGATAARHREIHLIILASLVISGFRDHGAPEKDRRFLSTQYEISSQGVLDLINWCSPFCRLVKLNLS